MSERDPRTRLKHDVSTLDSRFSRPCALLSRYLSGKNHAPRRTFADARASGRRQRVRPTRGRRHNPPRRRGRDPESIPAIDRARAGTGTGMREIGKIDGGAIAVACAPDDLACDEGLARARLPEERHRVDATSFGTRSASIGAKEVRRRCAPGADAVFRATRARAGFGERRIEQPSERDRKRERRHRFVPHGRARRRSDVAENRESGDGICAAHAARFARAESITVRPPRASPRLACNLPPYHAFSCYFFFPEPLSFFCRATPRSPPRPDAAPSAAATIETQDGGVEVVRGRAGEPVRVVQAAQAPERARGAAVAVAETARAHRSRPRGALARGLSWTRRGRQPDRKRVCLQYQQRGKNHRRLPAAVTGRLADRARGGVRRARARARVHPGADQRARYGAAR